ncbi:MAG: GAF domain-containing protein, partial [Solirubrobacteraceae bacterium]|nr:GAF domain-containing protein [Solirubrobacteraceae bacterium]
MTRASTSTHTFRNDPVPTTDPLLDPARLTAIRELDLDGASPQAALENLNSLAQRLLGVPVSVVSIVSDRRHFNVSQGARSGDAPPQQEFPLSHSFCQHVARSGDALIVSDAREHPDVSSNLAVRDHNVIAYAGLPLRLNSGEVVGAFCAVD